MKKSCGSLFNPVILPVILCLLLSGFSCQKKSSRIDSLAAGFKNPPDSVRPGVYWYFMDGNLSREAMTADLESMKEAGIGQVIFLEVNVGLPRGSVDFLSEAWQDLFTHAVREAERLGIEITLGIGPGWTGSGGPWVKPEQSMMHLVTSSVEINGPEAYSELLPVPEPYQPFFGEESVPAGLREIRQGYYEDVAVLAFPSPDGDIRIPDSEEKALYFRAPFSSQAGVKPHLNAMADVRDVSAHEKINMDKILDITRFLQTDGRLKWDVPPGKWTIMRFGTRNNGAVTRPAPEPGLGFECDKFDSVAFDAHFSEFAGKLIRKVSPRLNSRHAGWTMLHMDSWEMSSQNWTGKFRDEFIRRRGYDPLPFLPAYAGRITGSLEESERFLWDVRLTSQELVIEQHVLRAKELARQNGMRLSIEPYDMNPCADLSLGAPADVPMCEFWSRGFGFNTVFSCFEAASLAHLQGLPVVGAESFTAGFNEAWKLFPGAIKDQGDWAFCTGINRFNYHTFAHKPYGDHLKPGMTMGPYGVHWDRGQTWWPMVTSYHTYISRCSYLLQQGRHVADILYLTPEGAPQVFLPPSSALEGNDTIPDHKGYNFDGCSPEMLIEKAKTENGKITFPGGASYSILVLPCIKTMTPELLLKIEELVRNGAIVTGIPPERSPSLVNYPQCDSRVIKLAKQIWGEMASSRSYGKGKIVIPGKINSGELYPGYNETISFLKSLMPEDFSSSGNLLRFIHRTSEDYDIYFVSNRINDRVRTLCRFRAGNGNPELWDPVTGDITALPESERQQHETLIPMQFEPYQSFFVVFDKKTGDKESQKTAKVNFPELSVITELKSKWTVYFDPEWGGPGEVHFEELTDWSKSPDKGIRYFSGIARYETGFDLPGDFDPAGAGEIYLDLSSVYDLARVFLNGDDLGVLWTSPWQVKITRSVRKTNNLLVIEVANQWVNRLIGDASMPYDGPADNRWPDWLVKGKRRPGGRVAFSTYDFYKKDAPLMKSGLAGPIRILTVKQ